MSKKEIGFFRGAHKCFSENDNGFGGTQLCVLYIAKYLKSINHNVYIIHPKRKKKFVGKSGIHYIKKINEQKLDVIIDIRYVRNEFHPNKVYIHWVHDAYKYCLDKKNTSLSKYNIVITLSHVQKILWNTYINISNFIVISNPFVVENVQKNNKYNKFKIISFSARTDWDKTEQILIKLNNFDKRFTLHICSPSYKKNPNKYNDTDLIINHGSLSHKDTMKLLSDSFICLFPTSCPESYGCIFYECMYYGIPILTEFVKGSSVTDILPKELILPQGTSSDKYVEIILNWHKNNKRPKLSWKPKNEEIYKKWENIININ
tara:strand:+ start:50 stop:1003 length:954 start_codon:yes stop_codon:yes gene_type:complete